MVVDNGSFEWPPAGSGGGSGTVTDVTSSLPLLSSGGATPNISLTLTPNKRYIDFISGNDSHNGSLETPWKTLTHAYASVSPSINEPYTFYLSGGNNDSDGAPITGKPNVNLVSDYQIQIAQPLTISGGATNDSVSFQNVIFIGALTWIRNDNTTMGVQLNYCQFFSGPVLKQQGSGALSVNAINSVFVNSDFLAPNQGSFFTSCTFLGTTTFEDMSNAAYVEIMGGYTSSAMSASGGVEIYFSGLQVDAPFGASLTTATTANGTPLIQTDSGSVPLSITGPHTLNRISNAPYEAYAPSAPSSWSGSPTNVQDAIDRIAAVVSANGGVPIP